MASLTFAAEFLHHKALFKGRKVALLALVAESPHYKFQVRSYKWFLCSELRFLFTKLEPLVALFFSSLADIVLW